MSATVSWNNDQIIELEFDSPWTWKDYETATEAVDMMAGMARGTVSMIVDLRQAPQSSNLIEHICRSLDGVPENVQSVVLVGSPKLVEMLRRSLNFADADPARLIQFAGSMEEAYNLLLERRLENNQN
jgi:hypothetical protein